ncbi:methyl-accepting chemotaxis protein [Marinobacterium lacunae]|nr:methyl-accepting chemotaxis protein [Marinobacterium lacunae]
MTIKNKLTLQIVLIVVALGAMTLIQLYSTQQHTLLAEVREDLDHINIDKLSLQLIEKTFLSAPTLESVQRYEQLHESLLIDVRALREHMGESGIDVSHIAELESGLKAYADDFTALIGLKQQIGLTAQSGLKGELRTAIHEVEGLFEALGQDSLLVSMLQLRRHEKDFQLRQDLKYVDQWEDTHVRLIKQLNNTSLDLSQKNALLNGLDTYRSGFQRLVDIQKQIGLSDNQGVLAKMHEELAGTNEVMALLTRQMTEHLDSTESRIKLVTVLCIIALLVLIIAPTLVIGRSIIHPISALASTMRKARDEKDLTLRFNTSARDEIAHMAQDYNAMMDAFQALIGQVVMTAGQLASAAEELSANTEETSTGLGHQRTEVMQVAAAIQEMESAMQDIAGNTEQTAGAARNAHEGASESGVKVSENMEALHQMARKARETAESVAQLRSDSDEIGTMLDVIKDISDQTNLLALNASIEAARAGDHGRGFAVVADEVRTLASRSQQSAERIEELVTRLHSRTQTVGLLMDAAVNESEQGVERANETIEALGAITRGAGSIVDMTTQVASATEEQAAVAAEITRNVESISLIIEEATGQVEQNALASQMVADQAQQLQLAVTEFKC